MKYILICVVTFLLHGCIGLIAVAGTTASAVSVSQEVEEEYDGSIINYAYDKADKMYKYIQKKTNE